MEIMWPIPGSKRPVCFLFNWFWPVPKGFEPNEEIWERAKKEAGERIILTRDPAEAVREAQVINTDVWASMGQEDQAAERIKFFKAFQLMKPFYPLAKPDCLVLHCLPAHRGEEITDEVLEGPIQQSSTRRRTSSMYIRPCWSLSSKDRVWRIKVDDKKKDLTKGPVRSCRRMSESDFKKQDSDLPG